MAVLSVVYQLKGYTTILRLIFPKTLINNMHIMKVFLTPPPPPYPQRDKLTISKIEHIPVNRALLSVMNNEKFSF